MADGKKFDKNKLKVDIPEPLSEEFFYGSFTYGASKYNEGPNERNYRKVSDPDNRYYAAGRRHSLARRRGEIFDKESGLPHAALAMFNSYCLLCLDIDRYKLTHEDLEKLMKAWQEIFSIPGYKLPHKKILRIIKSFGGRNEEKK